MAIISKHHTSSDASSPMSNLDLTWWVNLSIWKGSFQFNPKFKIFFLAWTFISNKNAVPIAPSTIFTESHGDFSHKSCLFICNNPFIVWINRILVGILNFPPSKRERTFGVQFSCTHRFAFLCKWKTKGLLDFGRQDNFFRGEKQNCWDEVNSFSVIFMSWI